MRRLAVGIVLASSVDDRENEVGNRMADASSFSDEQKQYLDGFLTGLAARRGSGTPIGFIASAPPSASAAIASDIHVAAQDRFLAAGKKLTVEEEAKRKGHPLDMWDELLAGAAADRFPKGTDIFRHKFFGLFYVAPAQDSFMCRLRMPNGILASHQMNGLADIAERCGGGYADVTTRANLQIREIRPTHIVDVLTALQDLGLTSRGAGADNIRNVTGSPTAGIDPQELIDTRPLAHALHHYILNHRELYGLPRKFNIAFDGGGRISVLEDTNDIGFAAVAVGPGEAVPEGVYFRMQLGGITGHGDFARDAGVVVKPEECLAVAVAVLRVFIAHGDRTDRKRARLKYVLDAWGHEKFLAEVEQELGKPFTRLPLAACRKRGPILKHGHIGVHRQKQAGLNHLGVVLPVGRLSAAQLRGLARIAAEFGSGTIRLTVWQNLLISDVADDRVVAAQEAIAALGLGTAASAIRGALVACTGNTGCKFAATDTKGQAMQLADHLEQRVALDQPVNIHLTGCPHSCAQHYVGDIGLLGIKVGEDMIEGYTVVIGGAAGEARKIGREIYPDVPMAALPGRVEDMLRGYLAHRRAPDESFHDFARRHSIGELKALFATAHEMAA
jgi:ferredoxin-nitrite reductase